VVTEADGDIGVGELVDRERETEEEGDQQQPERKLVDQVREHAATSMTAGTP
jgi:hypothetical protein